MSPRISPSRMSKLTSSRAVSPPNRRVTWSTSSTVEVEVSVSVTRPSFRPRGIVPEGSVGERDPRGLVVDLASLERVDLGLRPLGPNGTPRRQQALGPVDRQDHECQPEHEDPPVREAAEPLRQVGDDGRADENAPTVALAADHHGRDEEDRVEQEERLGTDEALLAGEQGAGQTAHEGTQRE